MSDVKVEKKMLVLESVDMMLVYARILLCDTVTVTVTVSRSEDFPQIYLPQLDFEACSQRHKLNTRYNRC
jgi:preprotein translocase subunit SecB